MRPNRALALLAVTSGLAVILATCGDAATPSPPPATPTPVASASPSPTATPTAAPTPTPTATTTAAPSPTPTATPTVSPTATPTTAPSPTPTAAAGFRCGYPFSRAGTTSAVALVTDVRVGRHAGYDRVVFVFRGAGVPALDLERVSPPFQKDPSGLPLTVPGSSFVLLRLVSASGAGYASPDGRPTYDGPTVFRPRYPRLTSLVQAGDFEAHFTWIAGLTGRACYKVFTLAGPTRLVIDFQAP